MTKLRAALLATLLISLSAWAPAAIVAGSAAFNVSPAGIFGAWTHSFTKGLAGFTITAIRIFWNPNLFFDPTAADPGFLANQNFGTLALGATGFTGTFSPGTDGSTAVTMNFTNFTVGKAYSHTGDVDENVAIQDCSSLPVLQQAACAIGNGVAATDGSLVDGTEMAGSTIEITLGGLAVPTTLIGTFVNSGGNIATATWTGDVALVPEPETMLLCAVILLSLGALRRHRSPKD